MEPLSFFNVHSGTFCWIKLLKGRLGFLSFHTHWYTRNPHKQVVRQVGRLSSTYVCTWNIQSEAENSPQNPRPIGSKSVWPDLAKSLANCLRFFNILKKITLLWLFFYAFVQVVIIANAKIEKSSINLSGRTVQNKPSHDYFSKLMK